MDKRCLLCRYATQISLALPFPPSPPRPPKCSFSLVLHIFIASRRSPAVRRQWNRARTSNYGENAYYIMRNNIQFYFHHQIRANKQTRNECSILFTFRDFISIIWHFPFLLLCRCERRFGKRNATFDGEQMLKRTEYFDNKNNGEARALFASTGASCLTHRAIRDGDDDVVVAHQRRLPQYAGTDNFSQLNANIDLSG